jgi:hypothetical protein
MGVIANSLTIIGIPLSIVVPVTFIMQDTSQRSLMVNLVAAYALAYINAY